MNDLNPQQQTVIIKGLDRIEHKLDDLADTQRQLNTRLDQVEARAVRAGAISGGIVAVGTALAVELVKRAF